MWVELQNSMVGLLWISRSLLEGNNNQGDVSRESMKCSALFFGHFLAWNFRLFNHEIWLTRVWYSFSRFCDWNNAHTAQYFYILMNEFSPRKIAGWKNDYLKLLNVCRFLHQMSEWIACWKWINVMIGK